MPAYEKRLFYPVKLGEVFNARYQVLGKLGFGANSTGWFCHDLNSHRHVVFKIYIHSSASKREGEILKHLAALKSSHFGSNKFRTMLDAFDISGPTGEHPCLEHEPLLTSLLHLQAIFVDHRLPESALKSLLRELLITLDYLHSEAHVIHTDIQTKNIMIGTTDPTIFGEWDTLEIENPTPRKVVSDRTVYASQFFKPKSAWKAGNRKGSSNPSFTRAAEVVLCMRWTEKVDIWNLGVLIWDLLESRHMFDGESPDGKQSNAHLLAKMVTLLGPPPVGYLKRSTQSWEYWDESGMLLLRGRREEGLLFLEYLEGENKKPFLQFMRKMLTWTPEARYSARALLMDEWLRC
ncbi:CMGC/SRPK protein kinase [Blastomyces percursus]|uniref:non-specific serine/threonine protein kinase n=1 Tax=Blastomyces percursus TaxID=1658174 RepID=A0A1J9QX07_9EURO|nr:CMGC/SRPK protein kinase [Blastomyces percursus]